MSKTYVKFKFENEDLRDEFVRLIPNIAPDMATFLKGGLERLGIISDPEVVLGKGDTFFVNQYARDKGAVVFLEEDGVTIANYASLSEGDFYATLNIRTKNMDILRVTEGVDTALGGFGSLDALVKGYKEILSATKDSDEKMAAMKIVDAEVVDEEVEVLEVDALPETPADDSPLEISD